MQAMGPMRSRLVDDGMEVSPPERAAGAGAPPGLGAPRGPGEGGDKPWQRAWRGNGSEEVAVVAGSPNKQRVPFRRCCRAHCFHLRVSMLLSSGAAKAGSRFSRHLACREFEMDAL